MDAQVEKFQQLFKPAEKILITSHISPDPDAISSVLLLGRTLKVNYPEKQISMVLEEQPAGPLDFLDGYSEIEFKPLAEAVIEVPLQLFVIVDAPNFDRCSRNDSQKLKDMIVSQSIPLVIIDHHEEHGKDESTAYINNHRPATVQEVYELLFEKLALKKPSGYAPTTLLGIISDTARHKFDNPLHRKTYQIVSDLLDAGASIEELDLKMGRYDKYQLEVLNNLISHITNSGQGYTYSYVDDVFTADWLKKKKSVDSFKLGFEEFTNNFLKNFEDNLWGFAVYKEMVGSDGIYGVSFRAGTGVKDVSKIAHQLGGGGHKPAAGAKFPAGSIDEAINKVKKAVNADSASS